MTDRLPIELPDWRRRTPELVAYSRPPGRPAASEHPVTLRFQRAFNPMRHAAGYLEPLARSLAALHAVETSLASATGIPVSTPVQLSHRW